MARSPSATSRCTRRSPRSSDLPTQLEVDEARARWRELAAADPGLGPIAAFHDERLAQLAARAAPDVTLDLSSADADRAIRSGEPLLSVGRLALDPAEIADELRRVAANLAETAEPDTPAQRAAAVIATREFDVTPLLAPALQNEHAEVERAARELGVDASALGELVQYALQPALWEAAAQAGALTDIDRWERGYCLLCGSWPGLAELVGAERRRVLRCVRCGSAWSWLVLLCPYCGTDDHRRLGALAPEQSAGSGQVATCEQCHGYVKQIGAFSSHAAPRLIAEDVATLALDIAAADAGYRRPGEVDPASAGIPRLVREGRTVAR